MQRLRHDRFLRDDRSFGDERSLGDLVGKLSEDISLLMRQELQLAKAEINEKVARVGKDAIAAGIGGAIAYLGALALLAGIVLFLTQVVGISAWVSALLVGAAFAIGGYVMLKRGIRDMSNIDPKPRRTIQTVREDIQWVKEQRP
jgi:uncharacterized membrane protein YqjE